jgi:hypothetical protein
MSTSSVTPLSAGVQQLYNAGLLPSGVSNTVLNQASSSQLTQMADSSISVQEVNSLLGLGSSSTDSSSLSPTASALIQEINPSATTSSTTSSADPLTQAVNNQLTSTLNSAVSQFLPQSSSSTTGTNVNVVG